MTDGNIHVNTPSNVAPHLANAGFLHPTSFLATGETMNFGGSCQSRFCKSTLPPACDFLSQLVQFSLLTIPAPVVVASNVTRVKLVTRDPLLAYAPPVYVHPPSPTKAKNPSRHQPRSTVGGPVSVWLVDDGSAARPGYYRIGPPARHP